VNATKRKYEDLVRWNNCVDHSSNGAIKGATVAQGIIEDKFLKLTRQSHAYSQEPINKNLVQRLKSVKIQPTINHPLEVPITNSLVHSLHQQRESRKLNSRGSNIVALADFDQLPSLVTDLTINQFSQGPNSNQTHH